MLKFKQCEEKLVKPGDVVFTVSEIVDRLNEIYEDLQEICSNCQEFNCDYCKYKMLRKDE